MAKPYFHFTPSDMSPVVREARLDYNGREVLVVQIGQGRYLCSGVCTVVDLPQETLIVGYVLDTREQRGRQVSHIEPVTSSDLEDLIGMAKSLEFFGPVRSYFN